jgi:hypothetical protein
LGRPSSHGNFNALIVISSLFRLHLGQVIC